jgi:hypothetical protein
MNQMAALLYTNVPPPLQPCNTSHQSNNSLFLCSNYLPQLQWTGSILDMEEVAEQGTGNSVLVVVVVGAINTLQTLAIHKVLGALARVAMAGDLYHRLWEHSLCKRHLLCHLMHGTLQYLSQTQ